MTGLFDERERGYEAKWAHDEEMFFRVMTRRNALLGHWAAGALGLSQAAADEYVQAVIAAGLARKRGADPVEDKIRDDFAARNIPLSSPALHDAMEEFFAAASRESMERERPL